MRATNRTIDAVNELTVRWARTTSGGTAFSAVGVWPLLALLADGAGGAARAELADAVGLPAGEAAAGARELLSGLAVQPGLDSALGLWTRRTLELREAWEAGLPAGAHGVLTGDETADRARLDAWAAERTGGLIQRMPVQVTDDTELVLASALALRTRWLRPFHETWPEIGEGPWLGRSVLGLSRRTSVLDRVGVADTPDGFVTELRVLGSDNLDVHLLLGEEHMSPGQVLEAGLGVLSGRHARTPGSRLPYGDAGPGLRLVRHHTARPRPPVLDVETVAYDVRAEHDLLERHEVFGLTAVRGNGEGHFPGISAEPLSVSSARQSALARFGARGFEAAAVTAIGAIGAAIPELRFLSIAIEARFHRPFGFLALRRHTRLVLAAGWVSEPLAHPESDEFDESE
jgi:hypothetical protein